MDDTVLNGSRHTAPPPTGHGTGWPIEPYRNDDILLAKDLFRAVWRRLWVIALVALVLVGAAVGLGLSQTPIYEASIKVLVGREQGITEAPGDVLGLQQVTQTMAEVANTRTVANAVIQELDLRTTPESFLANMSVQQLGESQVIQISYADPDPERARVIADTIGETFSEQISDVSPNANAITATTWEQAATPESPISPNLMRNGLLALVVGLMLGIGLAFLLEYLDDTWRSPEEVEQVSGLPTLATIREFKAPRGTKKKRKE